MLALYRRELRLATRAGGGALTGVLFFLAVVATIPFALGPDLNMLARIGPAVLWIGALLASLYAVLFILLSLEAYSLLIGSLMLFAALAAVMYLTRNLNWGARNRGEEEVAA